MASFASVCLATEYNRSRLGTILNFGFRGGLDLGELAFYPCLAVRRGSIFSEQRPQHDEWTDTWGTAWHFLSFAEIQTC